MPEIGLQSFSKNSFRKLLRWHPKKEDPNQRGCREVVRYEYFVGIIPVFSTFSNFFKKNNKNYKSHFM